MTRYEILVLIVSVIGAITGLIGAVSGLVSLARTRAFAEKQLEFQAITAALAKRQLEALDRKERAENKADVTADLVRVGPTDWRFVVSNRGAVPAAEVSFTIPATSEDNPLILSECEQKLPFPKLEPGQSFTLHAARHLGSAMQYPVRLTWRNPDGDSDGRDVHVAL
jgi:hypothetical protein